MARLLPGIWQNTMSWIAFVGRSARVGISRHSSLQRRFVVSRGCQDEMEADGQLEPHGTTASETRGVHGRADLVSCGALVGDLLDI
jgi:hypothetical protein